MVDFVKRFRRTKSVMRNEDFILPEDNRGDPLTSPIDDAAADLSFKKATSADDLGAASSGGSSDVVFKSEPKGWRKSLRKLRWKRKDSTPPKDPGGGSSPAAVVESFQGGDDDEEPPPRPPVRLKKKLSQRWSYSPGVYEETPRASSPWTSRSKSGGSLKEQHHNKRTLKSTSLIEDEDFFKEQRLDFGGGGSSAGGSVCFKEEFFRSYDKLAGPKTMPRKKKKKQARSADNILLGEL